MDKININELKQSIRFAVQVLHGKNSHKRMLPPTRTLIPNSTAEVVRKSGVLVLIWMKEDLPHITFIKRTQSMRNHAGQIGFPGGSYDLTDASLEQTALREAYEEVGVACKDIDILGQLSPLYVSISNFEINPFVGFFNGSPEFKMNEDEVEKIIHLPLDDFFKGENLGIEVIRTKEECIEVPCFRVLDNVIWGATAMVMAELVDCIRYQQLN